MTVKEYAMRRFALSEDGYRILKRSTVAVILHDVSLMVPVVVILLLVCDVLGDNPYDYNLEPWAYVLMSAAALVLMFATYYWEYNRTYFDTYMESANVRISLAERLRRLPMSYFSRKDPTDLSVRIMTDVAVQESAMTHWFPELIGSMIYTAAVGVLILAYSPLMGAAALWPVPVSYAIILLSKRVQRRYSDAKNSRMLEVTEGVQECLEAMRDLRGNNASRGYADRLFAKMDATEGAEIRSEFATAAFVVSAQLVMKFGIVTTALAGGWMLVDGSIELVVFIAFLVLVSRLYDPLNTSLQHLAAMISSEYNMGRMQEIMDEPVQTGSADFSPDGYDIVFDHVGFSYEGGAEVLRDVSFTARQGEVTALVGPSGEGKSTAAKLAARFWDVDSGRITVGGVDISGVDPETLLSRYSIVFQDVTLFNTTVMDNIRIGRKGATDEEVLAAARAANCDEFVSRLPEGYATVIGENGARLSGGERQRVSIARAILKDAPIVLLDEATASLDAECETQVQAALSRLVADKTVVIVAHRMRTVEGADRVVVLRDGAVAEEGTPSELVAYGGIFARMVRLQREADGWSIRRRPGPLPVRLGGIHAAPFDTDNYRAHGFGGMADTISDDMAAELTLLQRRIVDEHRQVLVIFEGRSGRVLGRVINEFMNLIEPRGTSYNHFEPEAVLDPRGQLKYIAKEPAKGKIAIYDRSWYSPIVKTANEGGDTDAATKLARSFEKYLTNNGVTVVKFYLNISDDLLDTIAKEYDKGKANKTFLSVDHIDPKKWRDKIVMPMIASTNTPYAPWDIIDVTSMDVVMTMVVRTFIDRVIQRFDHPLQQKVVEMDTSFPNPRPDADLTLEAKSYKSELLELSKDIGALQVKLAESGRSMVIAFEGWDAAGKGGSIKRLVRALNPRGYYVSPVAAPVGDEKVHTYLWRFAINMPKAGHIVIFDRSWYGRMMVEPIEGLCTPEEYSRSAGEIRAFERMITNSGGIVIKFWMEISSEEQLARFQARAANPSKEWKITDEDWRNREKWNTYEEYIDRMISATNTDYAPWVVVESEDKKYGRLKVLRTVRDIMEKELDRGGFGNRRYRHSTPLNTHVR